VNSKSSRGEPELEKERIITKAICKVLDGFNQPEVPDALDTADWRSPGEKRAKKPVTWLSTIIKTALHEESD